jgi:hypothetical protein
MYGGNGLAGAAGAVPLAALPFTSFGAIWLVLVAMTLLTTGIAAARLARS